MLKKIMVALVMLSTTAYTHQLNGMAGRLRAVAARAMHTAQAAWNKVPQPVRKATEVVIQHPLKTSLLVTAACQGYLYAKIEEEFPATTVPPIVRDNDIAVMFTGRARKFSPHVQREIERILHRCGVEGLVMVEAEAALFSQDSLPLATARCGHNPKYNELHLNDKAFLVLNDQMSFGEEFVEGFPQEFTKGCVLSIIHHEAAHMRLEHGKRSADFDRKILAMNKGTNEAVGGIAALSMGSSLMRTFQGTVSVPRLAGRAALLCGSLQVLTVCRNMCTLLLMLHRSRNQEYQADKGACQTTTLPELCDYEKTFTIFQAVQNDSDEENLQKSLIAKYVSTHPSHEDRLERIRAMRELRESVYKK